MKQDNFAFNASKSTSESSHLDIAVFMKTATEVGGDYDFVHMDGNICFW
jgi:hypothetical protein